MLKLHELKPAKGATKSSKRKGRGPASGLGKTSGRGHKGQKARAGGGKGPGFEGGQTPIQRRLPKRGFTNHRFKKEYSVVSLDVLDRFEKDAIVDAEALREKGYLKQVKKSGIKVLANGELTKPVTVKANAFSQAAKEKIEAAGGSIQEIE